MSIKPSLTTCAAYTRSQHILLHQTVKHVGIEITSKLQHRLRALLSRCGLFVDHVWYHTWFVCCYGNGSDQYMRILLYPAALTWIMQWSGGMSFGTPSDRQSNVQIAACNFGLSMRKICNRILSVSASSNALWINAGTSTTSEIVARMRCDRNAAESTSEISISNSFIFAQSTNTQVTFASTHMSPKWEMC